MEQRIFGNTDLRVSIIGFGAWGIGGPTMAGATPIGWGKVNDDDSIAALLAACECGVRFFDTADFYGLGHSEDLIGQTISSRKDVIIATKVGHRLEDDGSIVLDYSRSHIRTACEASLKRLRRDHIDFYQLHSAKLSHLLDGECVATMEDLKREGKIRYWGLSLHTFNPFPEAEVMMQKRIGDGFQLVLNMMNQRALPLIESASRAGYGIIARMPLQFGLLTGRMTPTTTFANDDHRSFRLTPEVIARTLEILEEIWPIRDHYGISKTALSLSFCASIPGVSTIIPGIKTSYQATENTNGIVHLTAEEINFIQQIARKKFSEIVDMMHRLG